MKNRTSLIAATLATLFAGNAFASPGDAITMTVEGGAPLRATLLPTVSIDADSTTSESNPARMRIADAAPVEVTLMPTVRVTARANRDLAVTWLPTVRVTPASSQAEQVAEAGDVVSGLPLIDDAAPSPDEHPLGWRVRAMPR
ncbi:MAG TPA: hypothetical protein VHE32_05080 [Rhodanobacteraceae bacterium]|nr:hypothetical protein [Rhodanobacteraceae bacterium]